MTEIPNVIQVIFGNNGISIGSILDVMMPILLVVVSIFEWRGKMKLIKADKELTSVEMKLDAQKSEQEKLRSAMQFFGDMICAAYLANPNVDQETKKKIAAAAIKLEELAKVNLSGATEKMIAVINEYIPGTNIEEEKENILAEVKASEEIIDSASDIANDVVNKLEV